MRQLILKKKEDLNEKKRKGFTLVELIIVIAIIAIIAAMAIPKFGQVRTDAKVSNDIAAAKNIQSTTAMLVGNGTITEKEIEASQTKAIVVGDDSGAGKAIADRIDGNKVPKAKAGKFNVTISASGDVEVRSDQASSVVLAPASEGTAAAYTAEIKKSK